MLLETTFRKEGLFPPSVSAYHTREGTLGPLSPGQQEHIVELVQETEIAGFGGWASHQRPTPSDYLFQLSPTSQRFLNLPQLGPSVAQDLSQGCILSWSSEVLPPSPTPTSFSIVNTHILQDTSLKTISPRYLSLGSGLLLSSNKPRLHICLT